MASLKHIAVIMDGNSRWAKARGLPKITGHRRGATAAENFVRANQSLGIQYVTLYAFSSENWGRPKAEIQALMNLLRYHLKNGIKKLESEDVRFVFIGKRENLDSDIIDLMNGLEERSKNNNFTLIIAISYGGREEIESAAQAMARYCTENNKAPEQLKFAQFINPHDIPPPDLLIRTSGEYRLSNFLLWQLAYTELYFTNTLWPDFDGNDLNEAIKAFKSRERRYGK